MKQIMLFPKDIASKIDNYKKQLVQSEVTANLELYYQEAERVINMYPRGLDIPDKTWKKIYKQIALEFYKKKFQVEEMEFLINSCDEYVLNVFMEVTKPQ